MTIVCKSGMIGNDISYVVTQNENKQFDITLSAYELEYENKAATPQLAENWIEQTINIIHGT